MCKTNRRTFLTRALGACLLSALFADVARADSDALDAETLKMKLRTTTDAQDAFVEDVVAKANRGELPVSILRVAYRYAMGKDATRRVYFFRLCLVNLAKKAKLRITFLSF